MEVIEQDLDEKFKNLAMKLEQDQEDGNEVYNQIMNSFEEELESIFPDHSKKLKRACEWIRSKREDIEAAMVVMEASKFDWKFENDVEPPSISYCFSLVPGGPSAWLRFNGLGFEVACSKAGNVIIKTPMKLKSDLVAIQATIVDHDESLVTLALYEPDVYYSLFEIEDCVEKGYEMKVEIRYTSFKVGYEHLLSRIENTEIECSSIEWNSGPSGIDDTLKLGKYEDITGDENDTSSYFTAQPRKILRLSA